MPLLPTEKRSQLSELDLALARVALADRHLLTAAEMSYRRARSAAITSALAIGIGAALIGTLVGSEGRRRLASGVLGVAMPFLIAAVAGVFGQLAKSQMKGESAV